MEKRHTSFTDRASARALLMIDCAWPRAAARARGSAAIPPPSARARAPRDSVCAISPSASRVMRSRWPSLSITRVCLLDLALMMTSLFLRSAFFFRASTPASSPASTRWIFTSSTRMPHRRAMTSISPDTRSRAALSSMIWSTSSVPATLRICGRRPGRVGRGRRVCAAATHLGLQDLGEHVGKVLRRVHHPLRVDDAKLQHLCRQRATTGVRARQGRSQTRAHARTASSQIMALSRVMTAWRGKSSTSFCTT